MGSSLVKWFRGHPESLMIGVLLISVLIIIAVLLTPPKYVTIPTQAKVNETLYDIYVKYDSIIPVDPLQSNFGAISVFLEPLSIDVYNNTTNRSKTPQILAPSLVDLSNDNRTSVLKATEFKEVQNSKLAEIGKRKYEAGLTAIHPNIRAGIVNENFTLQLIYSIENGTEIDYTTRDIPISILVLLRDINPVVYLFIIIFGVAASLVIDELNRPKTRRITITRIFFWLIVSAISAALVFNQFREQLAPDAELLTNVIFALAFGFAAQRVIAEVASRQEVTKEVAQTPGTGVRLDSGKSVGAPIK